MALNENNKAWLDDNVGEINGVLVFKAREVALKVFDMQKDIERLEHELKTAN